jgi:tryptophan-rich sensory protein
MHVGSVRSAIDSLANSRGRPVRHVATGLALTAGAVLVSAMISGASAPTKSNPKAKAAYDRLDQPSFAPPRSAFAMIWPPLFLSLTLSGLRIWNAPQSRARSQALTLWGAVQVLNTVWMALGPGRLGGQLAAAIASFGTSAAYVWRARGVDPPASGMVAPYLGWIGFANALTGELWRRNAAPKPTIH